MLHKSLLEEKKPEDPIKHVIVLMMENKSYDQMLGSLKKIKPESEGVDEKELRFNTDFDGNKIYQKVVTTKQMEFDPMHEVPNVKTQLSDNNGGFIKDFITYYPESSATSRQDIMGYYPLGFLPALHGLGTEYTICDHWFSSVPGPTWTNRFFALSGTSMGRVEMTEKSKDPKIREVFFQTQESIFDRLNEKKISWRTYCGDFPISLVMTQNRRPDNLSNYRKMKQFYQDAKGSAEEFPAFSFIEPKYLGENQNDDHPPHNTMKAQKLIADTYNAIRANETLWKSSLFIVTYDEHGGFYDHVVPPAAVPPDRHKKEYDFKQLGVRVPAILVSPWVRKPVEKTVFDHTSILKYLINKWDLRDLRERAKQANSIEVALDFSKGPRENCLPYIYVSDEELSCPKPHLEKHDTNANHKAIYAFSEYLNEENKKTEPPVPAPGRMIDLKDKIGKKCEEAGYIKLGMWWRQEADRNRHAHVKRTLKIVKNVLADPTLEDKKDDKRDKPEEHNPSILSRCAIL